MSAGPQFDAAAFLAKRRGASTPAAVPPAFDASAFLAKRQAPAQSNLPSGPAPQLGPSPAMAKVGNTIFQDTASAPKKIMDAFSNHPVDSAVQTLQDFTQARQAHLQRASDAWKAGDYQTAAVQGFFGSVPFLGPMLGAAADEWTGGHKPEAMAHAVETLLPFLHDPAMAGLESQTAAKLGRAADVTAAGIGGAVTGAAKGGLSLERFRGIPTVPKALVGAVRGEVTARALNAVGVPAPPGAGGVVGAAIPVLQGAYQGARRAIAEKMAGPEVLDALAQLKHGKGYGALEDAQKGDVITAAQNATGKKPSLPAEVQQELTRPSEAPPPAAAPAAPQAQPASQALPAPSPIPAREAVPEAPAPPAQPPAPEPPPQAPQTTMRPGESPAEALFRAAQESGTVPATAKPGEPFGGTVPNPEPFQQAARGKRAATAETLTNAFRDYGLSSEDLRDMHPKEWATTADALGIEFPKTVAARQKLIDATIQRFEAGGTATVRARRP